VSDLLPGKRVGKVLFFTVSIAVACAAEDESYVSDPIPDRGGSGGLSGGSGSGGTGGATTSKGGSSSGGSSGSSALGAAGGDESDGGTGGSGASSSGASGGTAGTSGSSGSGGSSGTSPSDAGAGGSGGAPAECSTNSPHSSCTCHVRDGHDYWFCTEKTGFTGAEGLCEDVGLHLVRVDDADEDGWLYTTGYASLGEYWLGSSDASTPDTWNWLWGNTTFWTGTSSGTASGYENWNGGEPNASGECLVVQTGGVWDDRTCSDNRGYVCEANDP
jgi:hypothetical protein